ncbi:hypothetical protein EDF56_1201 [Novosphingobium sp. PhB165]|nr:hypothetical protein EDF56_1201 [Novosphingobium sp. PhB165]
MATTPWKNIAASHGNPTQILCSGGSASKNVMKVPIKRTMQLNHLSLVNGV